jgi:flagellar motor switch protein FliM
MEKVLNQQEIDDMVRAVRAGKVGGTASGPVVQPWDVRQAGQIGSEQLRAINQLHETFARNLSTAIGGYLRIVFDVSLVSAEHLTYREFLQAVPEKTYLASCELAPVGATAVLQLDLGVAFPIIDVMLGGEGKSSEIVRDITEIEEQVLEAIIRIFCRELQNSWQAISLEFNFAERLQNLQTQRLMPPEEKNLCLSFEIKMSDSRGAFNVAVPAVVSNALLRKVSANFDYQRRRSPAEAKQQIQKKLLNCFFPMELSLTHLQVPLQGIEDLTVGDVLTFPRSASVPAVLLVDDVQLCAAQPVRRNTRRAAQVFTMEAANEYGGEA